MTVVSITIDGLTVTVSHPVEGVTLDAVIDLVHHALSGHRYIPEQITERLNYDEMALPHAEAV